MWRQGDVMIAGIDKIPDEARKEQGLVLAQGESTGHTHRLDDRSTGELWELNGQLYLKVISDIAQIIHEEHKPLTLPKGLYRVWRQREYSPQRIHSISD